MVENVEKGGGRRILVTHLALEEVFGDVRRQGSVRTEQAKEVDRDARDVPGFAFEFLNAAGMRNHESTGTKTGIGFEREFDLTRLFDLWYAFPVFLIEKVQKFGMKKDAQLSLCARSASYLFEDFGDTPLNLDEN